VSPSAAARSQEATAPPVRDGRAVRAQRTRETLADALLDLLERGELAPGAKRIAAHAGVSERSVFQHFVDLETLFAAVADRQVARVGAELLPLVPRSAPLERRIATLVAARAALYERIAPVRRAALLQAPFSAAIETRLDGMRRSLRAEALALFEPELRGRTTRDRREVADALCAAVSFSAWEHLRRHVGASRARAERAVVRTVAALFGSHAS
jgi:AcrR family transcriptional regulator